MRVLVGLGNPGGSYARNRHNVGFMALEAIHRRHGFGPWRRKFHAEIADGTLGGARVTLMKPMTYMNESGRAVGEASRFFKLAPADILVVHDEVDLPPGKVRLKTGGGSGGHNGLRSLTAHLGDGYRRLRIGVGHPGRKEAVAGYVLNDFAKADAAWLEPLLDAIAEHAPLLAEGKESTFANKVHLALAPEPDEKKRRERAERPARKPEPAAPPDAAAAESRPPATGPFAKIAGLFRR